MFKGGVGDIKKSLKGGSVKNNHNNKQGNTGWIGGNSGYNNNQVNCINVSEIKYMNYNFNKDAFSFKKMMK